MTARPPRHGGMIAINGFAFRALRIMAGLDVKRCADEIGITRPYLSKIELGQRTRVGPRVFAAMLRVLALQDRRALLGCPHDNPPYDDDPDDDPDDDDPARLRHGPSPQP